MKERPIILLCHSTGPRLGYVVKEIFERRLGLKVTIQSPGQEIPEDAFLISYGNHWGHILIPESGELEKNSNPSSPSFLHAESAIKNDSGFEWNFDLLAVCFWMLSRMEEVLCAQKDEHGRFSNLHSLLHERENLNQPWIEIWVSVLKNQLATFKIPCNPISYKEEWSFDIDNPTAYRHKGLLRSIAGFMKDVVQGDLTEAARRILCQLNLRPDPNDTFGQLIPTILEAGIPTTFYVWIGDYGRHDKGLHWKNPYFRKLVKTLGQSFDIGLHPSYRSFQQPERIEMEKKRLEELIEKPVTKNRFHFLRFQVDRFYPILEELGFHEDHSMGFSKTNQFRASTSQPFSYFNLDANRESKLEIHPFGVMDSAAFYAEKMSPEQWKSTIWQKRQLLNSLGGRLEIVMHNDLTGLHYPLVLP